jgi:hypothetical protein
VDRTGDWLVSRCTPALKNRSTGNSKIARFSTKPLDFREIEWFSHFHTILHFAKFCRVRDFEFFNSILTRNHEIDSSFFRILYFNLFHFFENFKFYRPVFMKIVRFLSNFSIHGPHDLTTTKPLIETFCYMYFLSLTLYKL